MLGVVVVVVAVAADDFDEEDGEGRVQDHLEDGIYGYEDGAVFFVAASEAGPDEDLGGWVGG